MTKIRHASTVILIRKGKNQDTDLDTDMPQIYTIKRPDTMRFLPGYTAFPGGAVEPQDQLPEWQTYFCGKVKTLQLLPERLQDSTVQGNLDMNAHVVAAIREIFEETGILICQTEMEQAYIEPAKLHSYQQKLLSNEITFLELLRSLNVQLDIGKLLYIGTRLTPPTSPIRFNTRFYLTIIPSNIESNPSAKEIAGDAWLDAALALKLWERKEILCAPPTVECLKALKNLENSIESLEQALS